MTSSGPVDQSDVDAAISRAIGTKVRDYRLQLGFTVAQLAEHSELSKGMLSKIENAQVSPSLSTLARIAGALDVPMTAFFDDLEARPVIHVKSGHGLDLIPKGLRRGLRSQLLGTLRGSSRRLEPVLYTMTRNAKVGASYRHPGTEFLFLIEGVLEYAYGSRRFCLEEGDALQFDGEVTHGPARVVEWPARLLSVKAYSASPEPPVH
ncbi:MAG: XRE family transcriptional regulator [Actinomycetota bacterium]